jgi:amino acid adenylation domain-containing protein
MARHFETLLQAIVARPDERLSSLPLLSAQERQQLLVEWNDTGEAYSQEGVLHQLFEQQAERTPDAGAIVFDEEKVTYAELNRRANQLAHHLRAHGVGPDALVGVLLERSVEMVVGLLGILKAGAAYVPIDPTYPPERIAFMLDDANVSVILTRQHFAARLPEGRARVLCLETAGDALARESVENPAHVATPLHLAYVIYTSGSTGTPKGVAIEHRSVVAFLAWAVAAFPPDALNGVLASTSICFDLSVFEIFAPLSCGGRMILAENALHLPSIVAAPEVTLVNTVPSAMAELVRSQAVPPAVRVVNLAGEALSNRLAQSIYEQANVERVFNLYGPSEDTTYSTWTLVGKGTQSEPTIGRPISNTRVYVLDEKMEVVPVGVAGELYIGGSGLARGYLNRPGMTAERFVPDPFSDEPGARLYRTGDVVRYRAEGSLKFVGRIDHQVKVRGFRVEPGEVEARLRQHESVREAFVVAREDTPGEKRLVAYLVASPETILLVDELREYLKERLPHYMIPSAFVTLDALPLTPHGKLDRKALPAPELDATKAGARFVAPRSALEEMIADIWSEILGVRQVGVESNFFDLGGHSLLATRVVSRLRERCGVELPLRVLFESPTVAAVARYVETAQPTDNEFARLSLMLEKLENISEEEVRALLSQTESEHRA